MNSKERSHYIFLFSIFPLILSATTEFDQGLSQFNSDNWKESYKIFKKLSKNGDRTNSLDFYLGRSAFELGNYKEALIAFERVEIETDDRDLIAKNRVKLELGRTHYALGEFQSSEKIFKEVLESNPPENVREKIEDLLNMSREKPRTKNLINLTINLEIGFEENINSNPSNEKMVEFLNNINSETEKQKDSLYLIESANIGLQSDFGSGWGLSANILGLNQNYFETPQNDNLYLTANLSPFYRDGNYRFGMPIRIETIKYSNKHLLDLYNIGIKASRFIETQFVKAIILDIFTNFKKKDYETENSQDSKVWEYGLSSMIKHGNKTLFIKYGTEHENSKNDQIIGANQTDKIINTISFLYGDRVFDTANLMFGYLFRNIIYDDYEALKKSYLDSNLNKTKTIDSCRLDRFHSLKIGVSKEFLNGLSAELRYNYIINDSNHLPSDYSKSIYSFGVSYEF
jgi:tetratricopeptide (TPR) repeat protein